LIGQVYLFETCFALVTEGPHPTRRGRGSTLSQEELEAASGLASHLLPPDHQVYTVAVLHDSGAVTWPIERLETGLIKWQRAGRLLTP
jgi:hypothetical protein